MVTEMNAVQERFWAKVDKNGPKPHKRTGIDTECWLWTGATDKDDYGRFFVNRVERSEPAFRVAFEWEHGPLAQGFVPDHRCRVNRCVRPDHMEAETSGENTRRGAAKLTRDQVVRVKQALAADMSKAQLARELGVAYMTISYIEKGITWADVSADEEWL